MDHLPNLLLFLATLVGGSVPLWFRPLADKQMHMLLAFSGAFLLGMTLLHLAPESFEEVKDSHGHSTAGLYILGGFFLQLLIQRLTHGAEHGHTHAPNAHHPQVLGIIAGLTLHAAIEGLPLGFHYRQEGTQPSLYLAVAAHKLPEAMIATSLAASAWGKRSAWITILFFAAVTPLSGMLASFLGQKYSAMARLVTYIIPVVAGAFLHIATTIFYESGTKNHHLNLTKILAITAGLIVALVTLFFEHSH